MVDQSEEILGPSREDFFDVSDDDDSELNIGLAEDGSGGFHTKNDPSQPYQRTNVTNRKGPIDVKCNVVDVIHGKFCQDEDEEDEQWGTLIVLLFRFDPRRNASRLLRADLSFAFEGLTEDDPRPIVEAISFEGTTSIVPTKQSETLTKGADGRLGVGALQNAELSGGLKWEKTVSRDTEHFTTITGSIDLIGYNYGDFNYASWTLKENPAWKSGLPTAMKVGILLKRTEELSKFKASVEIKVEADWKSTLKSFLGGRSTDDPVYFDPVLKPRKKVQGYDLKNLSSFDLSQVTDVTFRTIREGAVKHVG